MDEQTANHRPADDWLRQAKSDRCEPLGHLLDRYRAYLRVLAERQIGGELARRVDASDVVQQTMLEAQRAFGDFHGTTEPQFMVWLVQLLNRNVRDNVRDHLLTARRAAGRQSLESDTVAWRTDSPEQSSPNQRSMRGEDAIRLAAALEHLLEDQRTAVRLRHLEGWSLAEIAQHLGCTPAATAGLIKCGVQTLRERLRNFNEGSVE
jgi:RNA polymerase sigma-70 factor (ECF subfamily)